MATTTPKGSEPRQELDAALLIAIPVHHHHNKGQKTDRDASDSGSASDVASNKKRHHHHHRRHRHDSSRWTYMKRRSTIQSVAIVAGIFLAGLIILWFFHTN